METKKRGRGRPKKGEEKPKNKGGRPPKYDPGRDPKIAESLAKQGLSNEAIADAMSIGEKTLYIWKSKYSEFRQALENGKTWPDDLVEAALYQRAVGYSHPAEKIMVVAGKIEKVEYIEHFPPDPNAAEFWLTNRRKDKWAHKQQIGGIGDEPIKLTIEYASKKE